MKGAATKASATAKTSDVDLSAVNNRIFFRLFQLGNTLQRQAVKELGISTVQWAVLGALSRAQAEDGMSFAELSDYLVVSRQNLDGVLKRLERDSHVVRIADASDRRARLIKLTPQGRRLWSIVAAENLRVLSPSDVAIPLRRQHRFCALPEPVAGRPARSEAAVGGLSRPVPAAAPPSSAPPGR